MKTLATALAGLALAAALGAAEAPKEAPKFSGTTREYWVNVCARCHGTLGNGRDAKGAQLPDAGFDFSDTRKANRKKDDHWVKATLEGKDKMPAFKGKMTEAEVRKMIAEVIRPFAAR
jgi:mono/diheme cytochrome c family protein